MRERALESFAETKKRTKDSKHSQKEKKKTRSSESETLVYLREKAEKDQHFKTDELDVQKRELELETNQNHQNQTFQYLQAQSKQMFLLLVNIANSGGSKNS